MGLKQGSAQYFYRKDAQGNIIAILDSVGNIIVKYEYAAPETINGLNLYAYCGNNPVMCVDPNGGVAITVSIVVTLTALFITLAVGIVESETHVIQDSLEFIVNEIADAVDDLLTDNSFSVTRPDLSYNPNIDGIAGTEGITNLSSSIADIIPSITYIIPYTLAKHHDPDPFRRANQKKMGRERKYKARGKDNWVPRNGKRGGPKPLPKHTPGRDHRKYFEIIEKLLRVLIYVD